MTRVHSAPALHIPSVKRNMHLKHPAHWEAAVSVSACTILSSAAFSEAGSFLLRGGITGQHKAVNNHLPCNVNKCKELTLVLSGVPAAAVLKKWVRREGIPVEYLVANGFRKLEMIGCAPN